MWWDEKGDSEDWQKIKNMTIFNFWGTNKERDEMFNSPGCLIISIIVVVGFIAFVILSATGKLK